MHSVISSHVFGNGKEPFLPRDLESYYRDVLLETRKDYQIEGVLGGFVAYYNSLYGVNVSVSIFDNKAVRVTPDLQISRVIKTGASSDTLVSSLKELNVPHTLIENLLSDFKFNYGYLVEKQDAYADVAVTENKITIKYRDLTKYNMVEPTQEARVHRLSLATNYGGTVMAIENKLDPIMFMHYDILDDEMSQVVLNILDSEYKFTPNEYRMPLTDLYFLRHVQETYKKLSSNPPEFLVKPFNPSLTEGDYFPDEITQEMITKHNTLIMSARFITEILSNLAAHNYKDFDEAYIVFFDGSDLPIIVPEGYTEGLFIHD
jgi:hypothetical protein